MADVTVKEKQAAILEMTILNGRLLADGLIRHLGESDRAMRMAISALSAQIPRVLAVEELAEWSNDTMLFVEAVDSTELFAGAASNVKYKLMNKHGCWRGSLQYYGKHIRAWSNRPTADQMTATPWTDGKQEG